MRRPVEIISGSLAAAVITAALGCTKGNEGQQSINPSQSPLSGAKTEATLEAPPTYDTRLQTPAETAIIIAAATATRMPETPTTAPATKTPFPPTKVPDTATAVPPTKAPDTATAVATAPATAPAKIEPERFPSYAVYANEDTLVASLPNGKIIVAVAKDEKCSNNRDRIFYFITSSDYDPNKDTSVELRRGPIKIDVGLLSQSHKVMVVLTEPGHESGPPDGKFTCPATEIRFKLPEVGFGKDTLVAYAKKTRNVSGTDKEALEQLERLVGPLP